jgi:glucose-6-phosphate isomerase
MEGFVTEDEIKSIAPSASKAFELVKSGKGEGSDFLGWVTLPEDYDKAKELYNLFIEAEAENEDFSETEEN